MADHHLRERRPVLAGLAEGALLALPLAALSGLLRGFPLDAVALALAIRCFAGPTSWQAALTLVPCLVLATLSDLPLLRLLVPCAVGLLVANLVARTESRRMWSHEHAVFAGLYLLAHVVATAFVRGPKSALIEGVPTALLTAVVFVIVAVASAVLEELSRDREASIALGVGGGRLP